MFTNLVPATNATTLELQVHSAAAFQNATYVSIFGGFSTGAAFPNSNTGFIMLSGNADVANVAPGFSGSAQVCNPTQASSPKMFTGHVGYAAGANSPHTGTLSGYWNANGAIDGFQVLFNSGNITSGTITIYGIL